MHQFNHSYHDHKLAMVIASYRDSKKLTIGNVVKV